MTWPKPEAGLVIRYSYLWAREFEAGREEGIKDRPCAIVVALLRPGAKGPLVRVLPVTHSAPMSPEDALEIPPETKRRLGLDSDRSWIVLNEANDFFWPGPDLRPAVNGDLATTAYGKLPAKFVAMLRQHYLKRVREKRSKTTVRT